MTKFTLFVFCIFSSCWYCLSTCKQNKLKEFDRQSVSAWHKTGNDRLKTGADQTNLYFPLVQNKAFALVVNQSSNIGSVSLPDSLCASGLRPACLFVPEHGFWGEAEAGVSVQDGVDSLSQLKIYSLYGQQKKPTAEQMQGLDVLVFDLQDVGCRFFTYLSSLHYLMEACAESGVELLILDRPNPNDTLDGPLLQEGYSSFVGMHPIPLLHACTLGELALMINGEGWLGEGLQCKLKVIPVEAWSHGQAYSLPIRPSPNLRDSQAICLYPSLCLFEGSIMSVGRGSDAPFKMLGHPDPRFGDFVFKPQQAGSLYYNQTCYGVDLREEVCSRGLHLRYLLDMYERSAMGSDFFVHARFFDLLAGSSRLREQILAGYSEEQIRASWQEELTAYRIIRAKYLLYPDHRE